MTGFFEDVLIRAQDTIRDRWARREGRQARRRSIRDAARHYLRLNHLPRDLGIAELSGLRPRDQTDYLIWTLKRRLKGFRREGWKYESLATGRLIEERLLIALAGELANRRAGR